MGYAALVTISGWVKHPEYIIDFPLRRLSRRWPPLCLIYVRFFSYLMRWGPVVGFQFWRTGSATGHGYAGIIALFSLSSPASLVRVLRDMFCNRISTCFSKRALCGRRLAQGWVYIWLLKTALAMETVVIITLICGFISTPCWHCVSKLGLPVVQLSAR